MRDTGIPRGGAPRRRLQRNAWRAAIRGKRFVIIASAFHAAISRALLRGAMRVLRRSGVPEADIRLLWVPGAFELPVVAARATRVRPRPDAVIALGAIIRGGTPQYAVLAQAVATGLSQVSVQTGIPVTCGVIVAQTLAQARARAGGSAGHRGEEAARAALEVLQLFHGRQPVEHP